MEKDLPLFFRDKIVIFEKYINRRWLSASFAFLAGLSVLVFYFYATPKAPAFAKAEALFLKWASGPQDDLLFHEMSAAFKQVPSLQEKYEPAIVQKLIEGGKGAEALQIAYHALEFARQEIPYHAWFAETTLLIERGEYQTALERTANLKERMTRECDVTRFSDERLVGGSLLYAHNLLRIACLQQKLKNRPGELAAWEELENFLKKNEESPTSRLLISSFQEKYINLLDYIADRKAAKPESVNRL